MTITPKYDDEAMCYRAWQEDRFDVHRFLVGLESAGVINKYFFVDKVDEVRIFCFICEEATSQVIFRYSKWLSHLSYSCNIAVQQVG